MFALKNFCLKQEKTVLQNMAEKQTYETTTQSIAFIWMDTLGAKDQIDSKA